MYPEDPAVSLPREGKTGLIPALVCAGLTVVLIRTGFLALFFLAPLGVCAVVYGPVAAWLGFVLAALGNGVVTAGFSWYYGTEIAGSGLEALGFTVLALGFTWIMAGNPPQSRWIPSLPHVRTVFRFIAASVAGALVFAGMFFVSNGGDDFLVTNIEVMTSAYIASFGADAAQQAFLEQLLTPERIVGIFTLVVQRGGALVLAFALFFFSRQAALLLARLRRQRKHAGRSLAGFYAPHRTIWVLTVCLPLIVLCRIISLTIAEIAAWNVLFICVMIFLAQGGGIVLFNLARRSMPGIMRFVYSLVFVFLVFSPGINVAAAAGLVALGIAENWLPLRKVIEGNRRFPNAN